MLLIAWLLTWQILGVLTWLDVIGAESDDTLPVMLVGWPLYYTILGFIGLAVGVALCVAGLARVPRQWPASRRRIAVVGLGVLAALPATLQFVGAIGAAVFPIMVLYGGVAASLLLLFGVDRRVAAAFYRERPPTVTS